jgi:23S rRNA pseudouridine2605 synthase
MWYTEDMNTSIKNTDSLSKYLAQAGVASRRKVVDIIKSKVVTVNGIVVNEPGFKVHTNDCVRVNDTLIYSQEKVYILLNKPKNCITTVSDERGRHGVMDIIAQDVHQRVYPIGRLDRNTTGLLVLTNDGDLALKLAHPRFEVEKLYTVMLDRSFTRKDMQTMLSGVVLEDGFIKVNEAYFFAGTSKKHVVVSLHSGKYRIVRRLFAHLGYNVEKLDRVGYAGLGKGRLKVGEWRHLTKAEVTQLKNG